MALTEAERREQDLVLERLRRDAAELVRAFGLTAGSIDAERPRVRRRYGVCDSRGNIRIRLRHATTGRLLRYSSLVDTLCHELAHLRYFSHGPRFRALYLRILENARRRGIYRPRPRGAFAATWAAPAERLLAVQLDLFRGAPVRWLGAQPRAGRRTRA